MDQESAEADRLLRGSARRGDTLFIWGYRPNIAVYSGLPAASRFWDSQPITGVPADRHLSDATPVAGDLARRNRLELVKSSPSFVVDGLSAYNPTLDIHKYPDLAEWFARYCEVGRAGLIVIHQRCR